MHSLPPNPYIPEAPARDPDKFYGREEQLEWIRAHVEQHALLVVHGAPRIGISSLLLQACQSLSGEYQASYVLLETPSPYAAMQHVTRIVASAVGLPAIDSPQALRQSIDDSIYNTGCKPVLIALDGFAAWEPRAKLEMLNGLAMLSSGTAVVRAILGWGLLENNTLTRDTPLRVPGLNGNLPPIAQIKIGPLTRTQASRLITQTAQGVLKFDYGALDRILQMANGRPYALQLLGYACYERRALQGRVSARDVQFAIDDAVARLAQQVNVQWDQFTREEQLLLASAGTVRGEHGLLSLPVVIRQLALSGIDLDPTAAREALQRLEQLDIFEPSGVASFRFSSGLLHDWAAQYANLPAITGQPLTSALLSGVDLSWQRRRRLLRAAGWLSLLLFIVFLALGGPSLVVSGETTPTPVIPTLAAVFVQGAEVPPPLPTVNSLRTLALAYMFRKTDKDKWRIYASGQEGSNPIALTAGQGDDEWPSWSPDGSKIAFASTRDGNYEIYVMNADGSQQTRLTRNNAHDWSPTWSPDGARIVFTSARDRNFQIYLINADGSNPTRLTNDPADDHAPVWSPDGRAIAFASKRTGNYEIYLMNPDGSAVTRLTQTSANNFNPTWSPDSRHIAFESNRDGNWEIYVMDGDGKNVKNITNSPGSADQSPAWSPDGQWIAFQSTRGGTTDIWAMHPDGSGAINWTRGAGNAQNPAWRPLPKP